MHTVKYGIFSLVHIYTKHQLFALEEYFTGQKFYLPINLSISTHAYVGVQMHYTFKGQEAACEISKNLHLMKISQLFYGIWDSIHEILKHCTSCIFVYKQKLALVLFLVNKKYVWLARILSLQQFLPQPLQQNQPNFKINFCHLL